MNKSLKALETIVELLERNHCWYRIVGSYAIDGLVGRLLRPHHDVDLIILEEELEKVKEALNGYPFDLNSYKILLKVNDVIVEIGRFARDQVSCWLVTIPEHKWPATFLDGEEIVLEGIRFRIPSKEFLLSTKLVDRRRKSRHEPQILERLGTNTELAKKYCFPYHIHIVRRDQEEARRNRPR